MKWLYKKNFEGDVEKIKGRLDKWKFYFQSCHIEVDIDINNLIASSMA